MGITMSKVQQISDLPGFYELMAKSAGEQPVNQATAQRHTAVFACFKALSDDLAALPVHVYQKQGKQVRRATDHPAYGLVKLSPNPDMRAFNFYKARFLHALATGNSYTEIVRNKLGTPLELNLVMPSDVNIVRLKTRGLRYEIKEDYKSNRLIDQLDMLHLKGYTWDGIKGETAITDFAKSQIGIGLEMDQFEKAFFVNGLNPGGIFTHPKSLGEKNKPSFMKALKKRFGGSKNRGTPMVLEDGMEFKPFEIKMCDQQFIELLKLNKTDVCGIFGVPESRISISGSNTNYNNSESEKRRYAESGLIPWAVPDEQEMTYKLLTPDERANGFYVKYNMAGFLRGNTTERIKTYRDWQYMGVPVNRLLEMEDMDPVAGGDVGLVQLALAPITSIGEIQHDKIDDGVNEFVQPDPDALNHETKTQKLIIEKRDLDQIVSARDKIKKRYVPLINGAVEKIVNRESIALNKQIKKQMSERADDDFSKWVNEFYGSLPDIMKKNLYPVLLSFSQAMQDVVAGEIDLSDSELEDINKDVEDYFDGYANQYVSSSRGQIFQQFELGGFESVKNRADEWSEKRTDKEVSELSVGVGSMVARSVIMGAGHSLVWKTRGKSCPLCNQLNGRKVSKKSQSFTDKSEDFKDEAGKIVNFRQTKYSPLHKGCDCVVVAG